MWKAIKSIAKTLGVLIPIAWQIYKEYKQREEDKQKEKEKKKEKDKNKKQKNNKKKEKKNEQAGKTNSTDSK